MSFGTGKNARQGKIARLSDALRNELNQRLLDGQSGRKILDWLNAHEEVLKKLEEDPEGLRVSDNNLSNWRKGGYTEWLTRRERLARTKDLAGYSVKLAEASGGKLSEGAAAILSGRIMEMLEVLDKLTAEPGPDEAAPDAAQIAAASAALSSLAESLASLRNGDQNNRRLEQNDEKLALLKSRLEQTQKQLDLAKQYFQRKYMAEFPKWFEDQRIRNILAGDDTTDAKTEKLGQVIFGEDWK